MVVLEAFINSAALALIVTILAVESFFKKTYSCFVEEATAGRVKVKAAEVASPIKVWSLDVTVYAPTLVAIVDKIAPLEMIAADAAACEADPAAALALLAAAVTEVLIWVCNATYG